MNNPRDIARNPLTWATALTLLYLLILATRPAEAFFGVPREWTWSGRPPAPSTLPRWWPAIAALAATAIASAVLDRHWASLARRQRTAALGFLVLAIPLTQILLKYIHYRYPIEFYLYRTIGPHNGFWQAAIAIDSFLDYLRSYPRQMRLASGVFGHLTTHPPGNILYLWLWRRAFELFPGLAHTIAHWLRGYNCADIAFVSLGDAQIAAALGQMTIPLLSGLTVLPLYDWAKQLRTPRGGWRAAALFALTPALSLFTMRWDTLYPLFAATTFAALHRGLTAHKACWWFVSGITVSLATFCSFGNAPLAPAVALYAALFLWKQESSSPLPVYRLLLGAWREWLALIIGGYSIWGLFHMTADVAFWDLLAITGSIQAALRENYSYGRWLFYNAYDILAFAGVPVGTLFVIAAVRAWKELMAHRRLIRIAPPALVVSATLILVNLAGVSPGEVGRLGLYWTTGMVITVALSLQTPHQPHPTSGLQLPASGFPLIIALLALQSLWMTLFLRVSPTGMPGYTPRHPSHPASATPLDVTFGKDIHLVGYTLASAQVAPGNSIRVTLYWQATTRPDRPYTVFVHLIDGDGAIVAQHDSMPAVNTLPTTCWLPGEIIADAHPIVIPPDTPPGTYTVRLGLYYFPTRERLPVTAGGTGDIFRLPHTIDVLENGEW